MHGRELRADQGLHDLERQLLRGRVSNAEVIQEIEEIESELGIKAVLIGTGTEVNAIIDRREITH